MNQWPETVLREICECIEYGYTASAKAEPTTFKFLRITDIVPSRIDWGSVPYCDISQEKAKKFLLQDGDIVIARTGATTGFAKYISNPPPSIFASYLVRLRIASGYDSKFIGIVIQSEEYKRFIWSNLGGAAQPNANAQVLTSYRFFCPPPNIQSRIAAIISIYDDLIENNTRRIHILERIAHDLYQEWFVHFHFPGHEEVEIVDSELGLIPAEWEVATLNSICSYINRGIPPKYDDAAECIVINQKCIRHGRLDLALVRRNARTVPTDKFVRYGDILVNSTGEGTLGRVAQMYQEVENCTVDTHVSIVRPAAEAFQDYLGLTLIQMQDYLAKLGEGATNQTELTRTRLGNLKVILPPQTLALQFSELVKPIRQAIQILSRKNDILSETRDLLLPRLTSGELDVSQLDIPTLYGA